MLLQSIAIVQKVQEHVSPKTCEKRCRDAFRAVQISCWFIRATNSKSSAYKILQVRTTWGNEKWCVKFRSTHGPTLGTRHLNTES